MNNFDFEDIGALHEKIDNPIPQEEVNISNVRILP